MRFREIFRFELGYQIRRVSTWLYVAALLVFAVLVVRGIYAQDARSAETFLNAPSVIVSATIFGGVIWLLLAAAVAGEAAARDAETRMDPLIYTAPISKADYLGGRFVAAFVLNALILLAVPAGMLLALLVPGLEAELLGPFRPAAYLAAYVFIALPNAFVATAIQFSWATRNRRAISSYVASVLLLITSHFVLTTVAQLLGRWELTKLLDVVGVIGIHAGVLDTWSATEKSTRLLRLDGFLLANRLLWLGIALGLLGFTYIRFRFDHPTATTWWSRIRRRRSAPSPAAAVTGIARTPPIVIPQVPRGFGFATYARQTLAIAWDSFRTIAKSRGGLTLVAAMVLPTVMFGGLVFMQFMGIPLIPRTEQVIRMLTPRVTDLQSPWVILPLLTLFYAGELIWREREAGLSEIADAAPAPEWVLFLGKFLGLGLVLVVWLAFLMAAGMLIQVDIGRRTLDRVPDFEVGLYLRTLFGLQLAEYLLFALLALVVHVLVNQKYVGHLVALIALAFMVHPPALGIEYRLLVYGSSPRWTYTDMPGFGPSLTPWMWFKAYWAAWALLLAVVASLFWVRGRETGLGVRLRMARHRFTRPTVRVAAAAIGLILAFGGFIFYNTNVLNTHDTATRTTERSAEYERRYGQYANVPQPRLTGTNLHVEIYPKRRQADIRGTYRLVNSSGMAIDSIHLATASGVETGAVAFDRPTTNVLADEDLGHRIYALAKPLQPGDALRLDFEVHFNPRGFSQHGVDVSVVANGTHFTNQQWLPAIGYQATRELRNAGDRRAHGLAPRPEIPSLDDDHARSDLDAGLSRAGERIAFDAVVDTDEDQIAVAPGTLQRTWTDAGRRYFHYVTDGPIRNEYSLFSADYAVREGQWNDVAIQIFHHPRHTENLERMVRSVQASLTYYTQQFGPYPYRHIKIVEYPGHGIGMHADAMQITHQEGFSRLNPRVDRGGVDLPFAVVAHEVAHQWWGMQVAPARVEGAGFLGESLATYSAMRVVEDTLGPEHLGRYLRFLRYVAYEVPRSRAHPPLLQGASAFLAYRKGPFALYGLSEYIGKERLHEALRRVVEKHGSGVPPLPTSLDLYRELKAVTPESYQSLLHDLFEANIFWELETERATAQQTAAGDWQVTLDVRARKSVVDIAGVETELPMEDWVEVGVFAPGGGDDPGAPHYVQKQRIRSGTQTITVTVPRKPVRAGIDPRDLLSDWEMDDNVKAVRIQK